MSDDDKTERELSVFFDAARESATRPDDAFAARLLADALAAQPRPVAPAPPGRSPGWFAALGGWPAVTGLATAAVTGIAIGVADPATIGDLAFGAMTDGYDFSGMVGGYGLALEDG